MDRHKCEFLQFDLLLLGLQLQDHLLKLHFLLLQNLVETLQLLPSPNGPSGPVFMTKTQISKKGSTMAQRLALLHHSEKALVEPLIWAWIFLCGSTFRPRRTLKR